MFVSGEAAGACSVLGVVGMSTSGAYSSPSIASSASSSVALSAMSANSTPSFSITVSNCEKGRFTSSFISASGVNDTLSWLSMTTRSPVLTLTLSRASTLIILNVPSPFIFTCSSCCRRSSMSENICVANSVACRGARPFLSMRTFASSCIVVFPMSIVLLSVYLSTSDWA